MRQAAGWGRRLLFVLCPACLAWGSTGALAAASVYESDMEAFVRTVDNGYPFLSLKGIVGDWANAKQGLMQRAKQCTSDGDAAPAASRPAPLPPTGSGRDVMIGWYKLLDTRPEGVRYRSALIPIFKGEGTYCTVCLGTEAPLKECPDSLEWALKESSLAGTTIRYDNFSNTCSIRIVDSARQDEPYVAKEAPFVPMTRIEKPSGLLDATAPRPQTLDDFLGFYQPIWLPWIRFELRKDGDRYLVAEQRLDPLRPQGEWKTRGEPRELTPLPDKLGFRNDPGAKDPQPFTYNEALKRFEIVLRNSELRMPLAKVAPSAKVDAALPPLLIGIPAWH